MSLFKSRNINSESSTGTSSDYDEDHGGYFPPEPADYAWEDMERFCSDSSTAAMESEFDFNQSCDVAILDDY